MTCSTTTSKEVSNISEATKPDFYTPNASLHPATLHPSQRCSPLALTSRVDQRCPIHLASPITSIHLSHPHTHTPAGKPRKPRLLPQRAPPPPSLPPPSHLWPHSPRSTCCPPLARAWPGWPGAARSASAPFPGRSGWTWRRGEGRMDGRGRGKRTSGEVKIGAARESSRAGGGRRARTTQRKNSSGNRQPESGGGGSASYFPSCRS